MQCLKGESLKEEGIKNGQKLPKFGLKKLNSINLNRYSVKA